MLNLNPMQDQLAESLQTRIITIFEEAGRDPVKVRSGLGKIVEELGRSAGQEDWSGEYLEYLLLALYHACRGALDEAVAREEYEWAAELFYRVKRETEINKL